MKIDGIDQFMDELAKDDKVKKVNKRKIEHNKPAIIIDETSDGFFMIDNDFVDKYAKFAKAYTTSVYIALKRHANVKTKEAFPGQKLIALEMGISICSVKRGINMLEQLNIISVEKQDGAHNVYRLLHKKHWKKTPTETWCNLKQNK